MARYNGPDNLNDGANSLAVNPDGTAVYVTGHSAGSASFDDYATIAYNTATGAQLWAARYNGPPNEPDMAKAKAIYKTIVEKGIEEVGTPLYTTNLPVVDAWRDYVQGFDAFGYDLVSINAEMGLHKTWIAK